MFKNVNIQCEYFFTLFHFWQYAQIAIYYFMHFLQFFVFDVGLMQIRIRIACCRCLKMGALVPLYRHAYFFRLRFSLIPH